ncbi:hypothetical protein Agub_g14536 [Astrephomene gubernaculifera]|uniref:Cytochrome b5 heme-binding domain-containing protein n=1 Tax=Astrephomene gubernaculifera TaxID=47775 RepID=A0AAD3E3X6_9CHLO|nr:hypothetical protein Agub_g14536 [Astrephomene gubernaculifera]
MATCPFISPLGCDQDCSPTATSSSASEHAKHVGDQPAQIASGDLEENATTNISGLRVKSSQFSDTPSSSSSTSSAGFSHTKQTTAAAKQADNTRVRLTRRQLRQMCKRWSLAEVSEHARKDDAWVAVDGKVYDISEHLDNHPGWSATADISTALSILAHAGTDCSQEFREIHRPYPIAWRQLRTYYIGDLDPSS